MILDTGLSYDNHVDEVVSKCTSILCQISRVKHIFDSHTLEIIINTLVFSKLYYCSVVWANTSQKNISRLQKIQNFAARIVSGKWKFDHISPVLQDLHWLPVSYMLRYRDSVHDFQMFEWPSPLLFIK